MIKKVDLFNQLGREFKEFDLRYYNIKLREVSSLQEDFVEDMQKLIVESITKGLYLILNIDDCSLRYEDLLDPDLNEFYGKMMLSPFMWTPENFANPKTWQNHLNHSYELKLDKNFRFIAYSKFVIQSEIQDQELIHLLEKRFENSIPLRNINAIILNNYKQ